MADVETKKEEPAAPATSPPKEGAAAPPKEGGSPQEGKGNVPTSLYAIYDVTARGAAKTLHEAAERGKVKDVNAFLNKIKNSNEVIEAT